MEALKYMKYSADNGYLDALYYYPVELSTVENPGDYKDEIVKYLKIGVEMDNYDCMNFYGACLIGGKFVPENIEEGKKLLKRAADNGIKSAMIAYSQLPSSIVDPKEAFFYKKMAEDKNNENGKCQIC